MDRKVLVTGIDDLRSAVNVLPLLSALRQQGCHITLYIPHRFADLFGRARLYDGLWTHEKMPKWRVWLKKRVFADVFDMRVAREDWPSETVDVACLKADVEFFTPPKPYILLSMAANWPVLRHAGLARRLQLAGFSVALLAQQSSPQTVQLVKAAAGLIDLSGRTTLPDVLGLSASAHAYIGGDNGLADLAAMTNTAVIALAGDDIQNLSVAEVVNRLPPRRVHG